jgi:hypothetical protein
MTVVVVVVVTVDVVVAVIVVVSVVVVGTSHPAGRNFSRVTSAVYGNPSKFDSKGRSIME